MKLSNGILDMGSAHLIYPTETLINPDIWEALSYSLNLVSGSRDIGFDYAYNSELGKFLNELDPALSRIFGANSKYEEVIEKMYLEETTLSLSDKQIQLYPGNTRNALNHVFKHILPEDRKSIAINLPNWHFWTDQGIKGLHNGEFNPAYFDAFNEEMFLDNYEQLLLNRGNTIGALLLAQPNLPLMFTLSESASRYVDELSQHYGIRIVVDDVLRPTFELGNRDTVARYFTNPIIVEGSSKRFGDGSWNSTSIISSEYDDIPEKAEQVEKVVYGSTFYEFYTRSTDIIYQEMIDRNDDFDEFLYQKIPNVELVRYAPSALTTLIKHPSQFFYGAAFNKFAEENGLKIGTISQFYDYDVVEVPAELEYVIRITTGRLQGRELERATTLFADEFLGYENKVKSMYGEFN